MDLSNRLSIGKHVHFLQICMDNMHYYIINIFPE